MTTLNLVIVGAVGYLAGLGTTLLACYMLG